jgi:CDP-diacylglycerol--glycerol-3-phosphate 3-phosphatidyltransferase
METLKKMIPNLLSSLRILLTPAFAWCFVQSGYYMVDAIILFTIAALTDRYDGYYARRYGLVTKFGIFLDPIADKILISTALILFALYDLLGWFVVIAIIARDVIVTGLRLFLIVRGRCLVTSDLGKGKTVVQFISIYTLFFLMLMKWYGIDQGYDYLLMVVRLMMYGVALLTVYSGIDYIIAFKKQV